MNLKELILEKKPGLSKGSVSTYASILKNLHQHIWGGEIDYNNFLKTSDVLNHLRETPAAVRKTILSALVCITDRNDYRSQMKNDSNEYREDIGRQEKSESQKKSWVETDDVKRVYAELKREADMLYKRDVLSSADLQKIQNYIIVSLLGGIWIPPRRSKDYVDFKLRNINKESDNYMVGRKFVFNSYKTARFYGEQEVQIPAGLKSVITKWTKVNPTEWLLFDTNMGKLTSVKLNQRLNKIFSGRKVGVNQLRHTYLTDRYKKTSEENKQLSRDMTSMGSSTNMADTYIKLK